MRDPSITIKPADKNLGLVLVDTSWYDAELKRMLKDTVTYEPFPTHRLVKGKASKWSITQEMSDLRAQLTHLAHMYESELIQWHPEHGAAAIKYLQRSITLSNMVLPGIYLLIKVHKASGLSGRPIVPSTHWITTPASVLVDHLLQEIMRAAHITHIVKDTKSLVVELEETILLRRDGIFVTADIASLYTNIDTSMGLALVHQFLVEQHVATSHARLIMSLLEFVMRNSYLHFKDAIYHQIDGTAMGTACAPTYANIVVYMLEKQTIADLGADLYLYRRFLDDVFAYVRADRALELQVRLNSLHRKIRFEFVTHPSHAAFLDLWISKGTRFHACGILDLAVHQKKMNLYLYIPYLSFHPEAMKRSFIQTELTRYIRNSSERADYVQLKQIFYQRLRDRGYPHAFLQPVFAGIRYADRSYFLWPSSRPLSQHPLLSTCPPQSACLLRRLAQQAQQLPGDRTPPVFVIPYSPLSSVVPTRRLLLHHWERIQTAMQPHIVPRPLIAYQSSASLMKQLVYLRDRLLEQARKDRIAAAAATPTSRQLTMATFVMRR
jgi:hypothetical protein